ncbi:cytochrome P450 [Mycobacterium sp.]|uniref:cytochrome P450 n=1 Tax=Mycobacterium sp. TaxID=1785 RepID=UPI002C53096D|nr:cytochrome P450 [Mycobacterium sp.]HTQ18950.1 cytochrome P450 [Mycobacterium sp.]
MVVKYDARLARSVLPSIAKGLVKNLSVDIAAKFSHRTYPGVADTAFDPFDPVTAANPYPGYRELLAGPRVHFNRRRGIFILSRHDDVRTAARADALLSSREGVVRSRVEAPILLHLDRPRHTELRRKVQPAFARGALHSWQPMVDRLARELVTGLLERPGADVVRSLAVPMPMRMIAYILGVPPEDEKFFRRWSNEAIRVANVQSTPRGLSQIAPTCYGVRQLHTYFQTQLERGALLGENTVMGRLVANTEDGEITADEMFFFVLLLLLAGNETTTNLLGAMFLVLSQHPDQFEQIRADPDGLLGSAIEELLRYISPIQGFYRTALRDYHVGDAVIPADSRVALLWGAANRDPRVYDNPDAFVAARNPTNHVAFGSGVHLCLGAGLARMEGKAVLRELVERVDRIDVVGAPEWTTNSSLRGLKRMEVSLHGR